MKVADVQRQLRTLTVAHEDLTARHEALQQRSLHVGKEAVECRADLTSQLQSVTESLSSAVQQRDTADAAADALRTSNGRLSNVCAAMEVGAVHLAQQVLGAVDAMGTLRRDNAALASEVAKHRVGRDAAVADALRSFDDTHLIAALDQHLDLAQSIHAAQQRAADTADTNAVAQLSGALKVRDASLAALSANVEELLKERSVTRVVLEEHSAWAAKMDGALQQVKDESAALLRDRCSDAEYVSTSIVSSFVNSSAHNTPTAGKTTGSAPASLSRANALLGRAAAATATTGSK